jgi:hypothetical protein
MMSRFKSGTYLFELLKSSTPEFASLVLNVEYALKP